MSWLVPGSASRKLRMRQSVDKKVIHVQSPPQSAGLSCNHPPFVREIAPPLKPVILSFNFEPVIAGQVLWKTSLKAGVVVRLSTQETTAEGLPRRASRSLASGPPPRAAPQRGACRPPAPLWPAAPLRGLNGHAGTPAKLAMKKGCEKAPTKPGMGPWCLFVVLVGVRVG